MSPGYHFTYYEYNLDAEYCYVLIKLRDSKRKGGQ